MASKGKKEKGAIFSISEEPTEKEVIAGKITETQWQELLETEEGPVVAGQLVDYLVDLAFSIWQEHYLEEEVFPHTVRDAKQSLLQIIEWQFLTRDEGEQNPTNDPTWLEDDEPPPSLIDSWARGIAPISSLEAVDPEKDEQSSDSHAEMKWLHSGSEVTNTVMQPGDYSRRHTLASTVGASSTLTDGYSNTGSVMRTRRKAEPTRIRPKARHPQARLEALSHPLPPTLSEEREREKEEEGGKEPPSSPHSYTPTSSPPSSPPLVKPLPYNMKPAQLRWQKDITYDSSGNIVDMVKLDPSRFPRHRVRPKVKVAQTPPHTLTKQVMLPPSTLHSSPLTLRDRTRMGQSSQKTRGRRGREVGRGTSSSRGGGGVSSDQVHGTISVREDGKKGTKESHRFPDVPTLPSLVDTIDPSAGVTVREGGRSVQGPKSPRKKRHFLLPQTAMLPVHPTASTNVLSGEVG